MCRVLVLDDDLHSAQSVKLVLETNPNNIAEIVTTVKEAVERVTHSIQNGKPYEAFLIDQQLGDGDNGTEVMNSLRMISPDTETIILSGYSDRADGLEAYRAGAFRYLTKPFDNQELLYLIDALWEWRRARLEYGWQKLSSGMMEEALNQQDFHKTADVVVNHSRKLGFERAHLFWKPTGEDINKANLFVGITCSGTNSIQNFTNSLYPVLEWFDLSQLAENSNVIFTRDFHDESPNTLEKAYGYQLPVFEAVILPMRQDNTLMGLLLLDYDQLHRTVSEYERSLLNLFARHVSVVLNRSRLHTQQQLFLHESSIIQSIGRQITTKAASVHLTDLLEEIRRQSGVLMNVSNFSVFLHNEEDNELDLRLVYENGRRRPNISRSINRGFEEYLLASQKEVLLSQAELEQFLRENRFEFRGSIPSSLLGVPLRVENKTIGGIIVRQYDLQANEHLERDKRVLVSVADQVVGAIQIGRLSEAEKEDGRRMQVLQEASMEMLRIAQENEDHFWLTLLTIATSNFGLGFNRALLFLGKENLRRLHGRMAVGTENTEEATRDWARDEKRQYNFQNFLKDLHKKRIRHTPFESKIKQITIELSGAEHAVNQVILQKVRVVIQSKDCAIMLPKELTDSFSLTHCAILPLRAGKKVLGLVIVDNKHNRQPLNERSLDRLQTLLDNAGLVWQTRLEQKKSESLLDANYDILGDANDQSLQETLRIICKTAREFSGADWAILLPFLERDQRHLDVHNIGFDGELKNQLRDVIMDSPRFGGVSQQVLRKGMLVINDIDNGGKINRQLKIPEDHFIKREGVKALIGAAVHSRDDKKPLGLLYLDYRQPHLFSRLETQQALSFASLAGVAISNARRMDELHQRRQLKAAKEIAETIGLGLDLQSTMNAVLRTLHDLFGRTHLCVLLYQSDERVLRFAPGTLKYYKIQNPEYRRNDSFPLDEGSIACRVARQSLRNRSVEFVNVGDVSSDSDYLPLNAKIQSEFCVSLLSTASELLGVLVLERDRLYAFDDSDTDLIKMVAQHLSIVIQRAQQSEELAFRSTVAAQTAWAADIAHEINNEVSQIRTWAYLMKDQLEPSSELQEYAMKIEESAARLSSTGPWSDQPHQVIDLDPFLERHLANLALRRNLRTEFHLAASGIHIQVNPMELQHVLRQLVRNAARAMKNARVKKLVISTQLLDENIVEILFQDSGPGIKKDVRLSIFQRPITTKGRGGYGLLLVRQMVEDMDGQIKLGVYRKGSGAAFSIRFPVARSLDGVVG